MTRVAKSRQTALLKQHSGGVLSVIEGTDGEVPAPDESAQVSDRHIAMAAAMDDDPILMIRLANDLGSFSGPERGIFFFPFLFQWPVETMSSRRAQDGTRRFSRELAALRDKHCL